MAKKQGAPRKPPGKRKSELIQLRVTATEKQAFSDAADLDGKKLAEWIRDRLRRLARDELQDGGLAVAFLVGKPGGGR
jgi:uncharacterized protein (DUF1778 family)